MADGERWAIFDDDHDTTLILHTGKSSQLSVEVFRDRIRFAFIDAEMQRSNIEVECIPSDDLRSLFRAMMKAQEASDGGR